MKRGIPQWSGESQADSHGVYQLSDRERTNKTKSQLPAFHTERKVRRREPDFLAHSIPRSRRAALVGPFLVVGHGLQKDLTRSPLGQIALPNQSGC